MVLVVVYLTAMQLTDLFTPSYTNFCEILYCITAKKVTRILLHCLELVHDCTHILMALGQGIQAFFIHLDMVFKEVYLIKM